MGCSLNHEKNWTRILNITEKYWTLLHKILNPGFKILWLEILNPSQFFICSWTGVIIWRQTSYVWFLFAIWKEVQNIMNAKYWQPPPSPHFLTYMYFQTTFKIRFYILFPWNILAIPPPPLICICYWRFKI